MSKYQIWLVLEEYKDEQRGDYDVLKKFVQEWIGHDEDCDCLDEGSPRTDCTCGYEKARAKALKGGE